MEALVFKILYKLIPWAADNSPDRYRALLNYARRVGYAKKRGYPAQCADLEKLSL